MKREQKILIIEFQIYFNEFYGLSGIYPSGRNYSRSEIIDAIERLKRIKPDHRFEGDSMDRELIRDILIPEPVQDKMYSRN